MILSFTQARMHSLGDIATKLLPGYACEPVALGESGAGVWRCTPRGSTSVYLKAAPVATGLRLGDEADRLRWMRDQDILVPAVIDSGRVGDTEFLLLEEIPGTVASDARWSASLPGTVAALGAGLARLHGTSFAGCPFDQRIARQLDAARQNIATGRVREDDFDKSRRGRSAADLFGELLSSVPSDEDLVFTHGDFCLPNIVLDRGGSGDVRIAGFIDCGRAGIADRHQDLALAVRSIAYNWGNEWVAPFLQAYGLPHPREEKLHFFTLLDEFF